MNRKMLGGIIVLIVLLGIAGVFLLIQHDRADIKQETAEPDKRVEDENKQQSQVSKPKPEQENLPRHVTQPVPAPKTHTGPPTYAGPLTFHKELLETNPVEALRLQAEERGHWSAEHIPPFPPDDTEAQKYARSIYLINYYVSIGDESNPILGRAIRAHQSQNRAIDDQFPVAEPLTARDSDLWRLTWTLTDAGKITPYGGMTRYGRARMFLSDYFPGFIDVPE